MRMAEASRIWAIAGKPSAELPAQSLNRARRRPPLTDAGEAAIRAASVRSGVGHRRGVVIGLAQQHQQIDQRDAGNHHKQQAVRVVLHQH